MFNKPVTEFFYLVSSFLRPMRLLINRCVRVQLLIRLRIFLVEHPDRLSTQYRVCVSNHFITSFDQLLVHCVELITKYLLAFFFINTQRDFPLLKQRPYREWTDESIDLATTPGCMGDRHIPFINSNSCWWLALSFCNTSTNLLHSFRSLTISTWSEQCRIFSGFLI